MDVRTDVRTYVRTVDDVMVIKPRFLTSIGYHIFLTMMLHHGFAQRKALPNWCCFFQSFENQICPSGKLSVDINLASDNNAIFRAAGVDAGRYIVTKMILLVPKMVFNATG